jgi:hypothetical protein
MIIPQEMPWDALEMSPIDDWSCLALLLFYTGHNRLADLDELK